MLSRLSVLNRLAGRQLICHQQNIRSRFIGTSSRLLQDEAAAKVTTDDPLNKATTRPTNLQKKILVWMGKYKTADEVPEFVNHEMMDKMTNKFRIRLSNIMMCLTALGCVIMVISGKRAAERGESVTQQNLDWHKRYNETAEQKAATSVGK